MDVASHAPQAGRTTPPASDRALPRRPPACLGAVRLDPLQVGVAALGPQCKATRPATRRVRRMTDDTPTPKRLAAARRLMPASAAAKACSRRCMESGLPISSPNVCDGVMNRSCRIMEIPPRSTLAGKRSRHRAHNQKMTVAAMQIALMKVWAQRWYRVAMRRQSLSLPNMRSMRLRCLQMSAL